MANNFSSQDSPYPSDSHNVRDITKDDKPSTSRPPVSLSYEDLEYDNITPAERYPPTDMVYEKRRHRHVNPNQNAALYAAGVTYNVAEDAGRAVGGLLGKAFREARKMVSGNEQGHVANEEAPKLSNRSYKTAQGKWHKSAVPKSFPLPCSNDLVEGRESDGEDEDDYQEAVDKDYIDIDTSTQPGITRLRERPAAPILLTAPISMPMAPTLNPKTPSLSKDPTRDENVDRYSMSEGSDSSFETAEGGVDWPLNNEQKARHMIKVAKRRVEQIQAKREGQIEDLEDPKVLARRMREDERERKAKAFIKRYRAKEARDKDKDMVEVIIKKSHDAVEQVRPRPESKKPDQQIETPLAHHHTKQASHANQSTQKVRHETSRRSRGDKQNDSHQSTSRTVEDAHAPMRIRAALREEDERRGQLEQDDQVHREELKYEHRLLRQHRRAQEPVSYQTVYRGYAPTVIVPSYTSYRARADGTFPIGLGPGSTRRSPPYRREADHEDEVSLMNRAGDASRVRKRERERQVVREGQHDTIRQRSVAQTEHLTRDVGALYLGSSSSKDENKQGASDWHATA